MLQFLRQWFGGPSSPESKPSPGLMPETQACPVCSADVRYYPRYPRYVCGRCADQAVSDDGRPLQFFDSPAFTGRYEDTGAVYPLDVCLVRGVRCRARPAHLGGIVIEVAD